jgi:predicted HTH domain antitoxin
MSTVTLELDQDVIAILEQQHRPIGEAARDMIVFELYRRGSLSSGKASQLLALPRYEFIQRASQVNIPRQSRGIFTHDSPLLRRKTGKQSEDHLTHRTGGVDGLSHTAQYNTVLLLQVIDRGDTVDEVSGETVELPHQEG